MACPSFPLGPLRPCPGQEGHAQLWALQPALAESPPRHQATAAWLGLAWLEFTRILGWIRFGSGLGFDSSGLVLAWFRMDSGWFRLDSA